MTLLDLFFSSKAAWNLISAGAHLGESSVRIKRSGRLTRDLSPRESLFVRVARIPSQISPMCAPRMMSIVGSRSARAVNSWAA